MNTLKKDRSLGALHTGRSKEAAAAALYTGRLNTAMYDADGRLIEVINDKERNRARQSAFLEKQRKLLKSRQRRLAE